MFLSSQDVRRKRFMSGFPLFSADLDQRAAVDRQRHAGDEIGLVGAARASRNVG
jgi:hypothetical protein